MSYVYFKCRCPCRYCKAEGPIYQWICPYCHSKKLFGDNAKITCSHCGKKPHFIWNASFKCGEGPKKEEYNSVSFQSLCLILSTMGSIQNAPPGFFKRVSLTILENADEFEDLL